jgi:hypothetical protein
MKIKISISLIILFILALSISSAYADVIEPGQKNINLSYKITNINDFSDYVFLLHGTPSPTVEILNSSEFSFYKLSAASIYSVKKSNFNQDIMNQNDTTIENYFNNNSDVIHSNLELSGSYGTVNESSNLKSAIIELEIVSANDTSLLIKKSKIIFNFTDGTTQTKDFVNDNTTPNPSKNQHVNIDYLWYIILPIIAAIIIIAILIARRR